MTRKNVLLLTILPLPFFNAPFLNDDLFDITGLKLINLALGLLLWVFLTGTKTFRAADGVERRTLWVLGVYVAFFSLSIFRSLDNIPTFNAELPEDFGPNLSNYILSYYIRPLLELVPFIFIVREMRTEKDTEAVLKAVAGSIFLLSCTFIVVIVMNPFALGMDRNLMSTITGKYLGLHYNDIAAIYFSAAPLVAFLALKRGGFWMLNLVLAAVSILLLQSRTGVIVFGTVVAISFQIFRRSELLFVGAGLVVAGAMAKLAPTLTTLATQGVHGTHFTVDTLLSDRSSAMWIPLIAEWTSDSNLFFFGAGKYAILTSPLWHLGKIFQGEHAHNAFIDFFLDNGIIILTGLVLAIAVLLRKAWRVGKRAHSQLYWCLLLCPLAYLMGSVTGESMFPSYMNMLVYPILALLINVARLYGTREDKSDPAKQMRNLPAGLASTGLAPAS